MLKPLCIYHGNCADGFAAAWVYRKWLKEERNTEADFFAGFYQNPPPTVVDRHVILVDFSYKRDILLRMAEQAHSILILDHHKTAEADLQNLPGNVQTTFDMDRSGAMITWDHFFPDTRPPRLIDVIQDRDLWRFRLGQDFTREVQACLFSFPYDFDTWTGLMNMNVQDLRRDGSAIERKHFKDIRELLLVVQHQREIGGFLVPVANLPYIHSSDAGHIMAKGQPFAACYWDIPDGRVFSLRSAPDGEDVSAIAKQYGGGGHRNAAGFTVPITHPLAQRENLGAKNGPDVSGDLQSTSGRS